MQTHSQSIESMIMPIRIYNQKLDLVNHKLSILKLVEKDCSSSMMSFLALEMVIPKNIYLTQLEISNITKTISFYGVTNDPINIARLLENLNESNILFSNPILRSNNILEQSNYNFEIVAHLNESYIRGRDVQGDF